MHIIQTILQDFKKLIEETELPLSEKQEKYFHFFHQNLQKGYQYYRNLFSNSKAFDELQKKEIESRLDALNKNLNNLAIPV